MTTAPLQPQALCEQVADRIREQVLRRELVPGEPINEAAMVTRYGVSRTPVREALRLLQHEGLLTAHVRRGMVVSVFSPEEQQEAHELRRLLQRFVQERAGQCHPGDHALSRHLLTLIESRLRFFD